MGVLSTITGFLSGGDIVKDIGGVLDNLHTSGEEKIGRASCRERV